MCVCVCLIDLDSYQYAILCVFGVLYYLHSVGVFRHLFGDVFARFRPTPPTHHALHRDIDTIETGTFFSCFLLFHFIVFCRFCRFCSFSVFTLSPLSLMFQLKFWWHIKCHFLGLQTKNRFVIGQKVTFGVLLFQHEFSSRVSLFGECRVVSHQKSQK